MPRNKRSVQLYSSRARRRYLRAAATKPKQLLWSVLRNRRRLKHKFRRQYSIGPFIAYFACPEIKLVVEIDGDYHEMTWERDQSREEYIRAQGFDVVRFPTEEVLENLERGRGCDREGD